MYLCDNKVSEGTSILPFITYTNIHLRKREGSIYYLYATQL